MNDIRGRTAESHPWDSLVDHRSAAFAPAQREAATSRAVGL
jgi:hypothetical protein